jgi:hypothetical protein
MIKNEQPGSINEPEKRQKFIPSLKKLQDFSMRGVFKQIKKEITGKPLQDLIIKANQKKSEIIFKLEKIKKEMADKNINSDLLFPDEYQKMQIEKGKNIKDDLIKCMEEIDYLKTESTLSDEYRMNLRTILKTFFNFGGLSKRTLVLPLKNTVSQKEIIDINSSKNKLASIMDVLNMNREVLVQAEDSEILKYLKDNEYHFQDEQKDFYECRAFNKKNVKVNLIDEFKKIKDSVKSLESKKNILSKMKPELAQYEAISSDVKKIIGFKDHYLTRMEIIKNQSDDLENIDNISVVVLTWLPRQIMSQSTGTVWKSCMSYSYLDDEQEGQHVDNVGGGMQEGVFIAWLAKLTDIKELKEPKARLLIKPFFNSQGEVVWWPSKIYHDGSLTGQNAILFKRVLKNYCYIRQRKNFSGLRIDPDQKTYEDDSDTGTDDLEDSEEAFLDPRITMSDGGINEINLNSKTFEYIVKENETAIYSLFNSIGFTNKKMFDFLEKQDDDYFDEDVIAKLLKISYLTNNLFFLNYTLQKVESIDSGMGVEYIKFNEVICDNIFNEKSFEIYFNFLKKIDYREKLIFRNLFVTMIDKIVFKKENIKSIDFFLKYEDILKSFISNIYVLKILFLRYEELNKVQKKKISNLIKIELQKEKDLKEDYVAFLQLFIDTHNDGDIFFKELQDLVNKNDMEPKKYFNMILDSFKSPLEINNIILKNIIKYFEMASKETQAIILSLKITNKLTILYINNFENLDKALIKKMKEQNLINGAKIDRNQFNSKVLRDEELLFDFLTDKESDYIVRTFADLKANRENNLGELLLKINKKFPEKKIFEAPEVLKSLFDYSTVNLLNEEILKILLGTIDEQILMMNVFKTGMSKCHDGRFLMDLIPEVFKNTKLKINDINLNKVIYYNFTSYFLSQNVSGIPFIMIGKEMKIIYNNKYKKLLTHLDEESFILFVEKRFRIVYQKESFAINGFIYTKALAEYFLKSKFLDRFVSNPITKKNIMDLVINTIRYNNDKINTDHKNNLKKINGMLLSIPEENLELIKKIFVDVDNIDFFLNDVIKNNNGADFYEKVYILLYLCARFFNFTKDQIVNSELFQIALNKKEVNDFKLNILTIINKLYD